MNTLKKILIGIVTFLVTSILVLLIPLYFSAASGVRIQTNQHLLYYSLGSIFYESNCLMKVNGKTVINKNVFEDILNEKKQAAKELENGYLIYTDQKVLLVVPPSDTHGFGVLIYDPYTKKRAIFPLEVHLVDLFFPEAI